ncbi:MAG: B12-binding domain-containing radical SAM protein [Proteobacteria bacterium]|nr:B12-binding domain-containing radical SAM protein [Pseudomonadota bacterium]
MDEVKDMCGRRILCVFPRYAPAFGNFQYSYPLTGARALMPPQGLLLIAAALPPHWQVRFIDENMDRATDADFAWAHAVFVSGMHIQRAQMQDICRRAHRHDRVTALGGPSVSACPENYPDFDYLHVGEMGDATEELFARLARDTARPPQQVVLKTTQRRDLADFPVPAYELARLDLYLTGSIQFSSGCPYECEFCDIPALYGRTPRLKTPQQVLAELDKLLACGQTGAVYFVDDNFIAHRRAVRELLPHLVEWQKRNGYPLYLSCEATLNIAKRPEILELMRAAMFHSIFCGIETPDPEALKSIAKQHNNMVPILEAVSTINRHGMEVVSGIILGLDSDTPQTGDALIEFVEQSRIPMLTMNLLQALPRTPLWDRLKREGRLLADNGARESNVDFRMPYEQVLSMWKDCISRAYHPRALFARYEHHARGTYRNRFAPPATPQRASWKNIRRGLGILGRILWHVGLRGDYRRHFWGFALRRAARGEIESLISVAILAHHLILFAREASAGRKNASYYSERLRGEALAPAE